MVRNLTAKDMTIADNETNSSTSQVVKQDCQPCRYVGTGLFFLVAAYIWYNTRSIVYGGSIYSRIPFRLIAVGSLYMSVARFIYLPPFKHLAPKRNS